MSLNRKTATGREILATSGDVLVGGKDYEVYSENETMIGYWTDGKPLYRKVVQMTTSSTSGSSTYSSAIPNFGTLVKANGYYLHHQNYYVPIEDSSSSANIVTFSIYTDGRIGVYMVDNTVGRKSRPVTIILEYTKTTDQPVTDTNTYSTEEKLTGETDWTGRPIYRKVVPISWSAGKHDYESVLNVNNVDNLIYSYIPGCANIYVSTTNNLAYDVKVNKSTHVLSVYVQQGSANGAFSGNIILEYSKVI